MSLNEQVPPPPPGQPQYPNFQTPPPPPQQERTSGLAITGLILAFVLPAIGFIVSVIAIFKTGPGKAKGRGLAVAGAIIGFLISAGITILLVAVVFAVKDSTVADPGCVDGKAAIIKGAEKVDAASLQTTVDELKAAAAKAKHEEVRTAMNTMADDYAQLLNAIKTGDMPAGLEAKISTDVDKVDSLCTIGS